MASFLESCGVASSAAVSALLSCYQLVRPFVCSKIADVVPSLAYCVFHGSPVDKEERDHPLLAQFGGYLYRRNQAEAQKFHDRYDR